MNRIFLLLLFVYNVSFAVNDTLISDTTIYFHELHFVSGLEEKVFKEVYETGKADPVALFYAVGEEASEKGLSEASARLEKLISSLQQSSVLSKKPARKIKVIYGSAHEAFLKKYELRNGFNEIFQTGNYNCVSATALYAIIFERLDIPYAIKVLPTHVYPIAYPEGEQIMIETTDPVFGYYEYNKKFQLKYAEHLVNTKFVSKDELLVKGYEAVFREYFFPKDQVSLKELGGLQYFNKGIYELEEENNDVAVAYLEKAMFLHPDNRVAFSLIATYGLVLNDADYNDEKQIEYLLRLMRYDELIDEKDFFKREFYKITNTHLLANNDTAYYEKIYRQIMEHTSDEELKKEFSMIYYLGRAEVFDNQLQYAQSETFVKKAYELEPGNQRLLNDYVVTIIRNLENGPSLQAAIEHMLKTEEDLPELISNPKYLAYKADVCARLMAQAYSQSDRNKGDTYRKGLEKLLENGVNSFVITQNIAVAYSNAASCYYRNGNKDMARRLLNKGLEYAPGNYELNSRLKMLR